MERLFRTAARVARKVGISVSRYPPYNSLAHHLRDLINLNGIQLVIDVGAHHGEFGRMVRRECGYRGPIVSFEPASEAFCRLASAADSDWRVYQIALGAEDGEAVLHLYGASDLNSLLSPTRYGTNILDLSQRGTEPTVVRRLDDVLGDIGISVAAQPTLVKIDTQGQDLAVLAGGRSTLANARLLQIEIPVFQLYDGSPDFLASLSAVLSIGYDVTGFFPVLRDRHQRVIEFDCVMVRNGVGDEEAVAPP